MKMNILTRKLNSSAYIPYNMIPLFVYGTLKRGEPNHNILSKYNSAKWKFVCEAETCDKFPMVIATKYNVPFLLHKLGTGAHVQGEVYAVNMFLMEKLDKFFDYPKTYSRHRYKVINLNSEKPIEIECWLYFIDKFKDELLNFPRISVYNRFKNYPKYMPPENRYREEILKIV